MNASKTRRRPPRSTYSYAIEEEFICIIDHDKGGRSVTNDAKHVIADLVAAGIDLSKYCVIYRDSAGVWDAMRTADGAFAGFFQMGARSKEEAKACVWTERRRLALLRQRNKQAKHEEH
ncbi:hypothetical protein [Paraburkholderia hospita]|uniref:hypothetical protein n=1 Tax=Paraburkholderia hospita TaxID=169430 RepID=UPI000DEFFE31|nr:hypothetical protein [Paraburkholderia hospita]AXF04766.1 hypothetical protein CUJ88_41075 [Paraburkholderia hospita]